MDTGHWCYTDFIVGNIRISLIVTGVSFLGDFYSVTEGTMVLLYFQLHEKYCSLDAEESF